MKLIDYWKLMGSEDRERFARRAGTSTQFLRAHVMSARGPRRVPMLKRIFALSLASQGNVSPSEAVEHFKGLAYRQALGLTAKEGGE